MSPVGVIAYRHVKQRVRTHGELQWLEMIPSSCNCKRTNIAEMRRHTEPYTVTRGGREFDVLPNVFPPYIDSEMIAPSVHIEESDEVLDVGSGSGFIAVTAAASAKSRCGEADIIPGCIDTIRANAVPAKGRRPLSARQADVFLMAMDRCVDHVQSRVFGSCSSRVVERYVWDLAMRRFEIYGRGWRHLKRPEDGILSAGGTFGPAVL
jgi:hypothetical protein